MEHKHKVKLARKMRAPAEEAAHVPIFQTKAWDTRKKARLQRVRTQAERIYARRKARAAALERKRIYEKRLEQAKATVA